MAFFEEASRTGAAILKKHFLGPLCYAPLLLEMQRAISHFSLFFYGCSKRRGLRSTFKKG
jgi:hypothetical protein